jgi:hypothetical protein
MVTSIYSNKKGIYQDLYREIDAENKKKTASQAQKPRKGIYVEMYKQIEFKNNDNQNNSNNLYALAFNKLIKDISSRVTYCFSTATNRIKMLIVICMVANKPINSYIENNLQTYQNQQTHLRHPELVSGSIQ